MTREPPGQRWARPEWARRPPEAAPAEFCPCTQRRSAATLKVRAGRTRVWDGSWLSGVEDGSWLQRLDGSILAESRNWRAIRIWSAKASGNPSVAEPWNQQR